MPTEGLDESAVRFGCKEESVGAHCPIREPTEAEVDLPLDEQVRRSRALTLELASRLSLRRQHEMAAWLVSLNQPAMNMLALEIEALADASIGEEG